MVDVGAKGGHRAPRGRPRDRAHEPGDRTGGLATVMRQRATSRYGPPRGDHGREAHRRADPPLPLPPAELRRRRHGVDASARTRRRSPPRRARRAQTGVEMEALTAASVAALTVYDMVKGLEKGVEIGPIVLVEKTGGKSGTWRREDQRS